MTTTTNRTKGLQSKHWFAAGLLNLISMKGFSSDLLTDVSNKLTNLDTHHYFLAIIITVLAVVATAKYYSGKSEKISPTKKTRLMHHRNRRIKNNRMERIKPVVIDIMGL